MKKFKKLEEYSDDELIIIVYDDKENWQKEAVEYANHLLSIRGINDDYAKKRIVEIRNEVEIFWKKELAERKNESYSVFEFIYMSIFWIDNILRDWYLNKYGYSRKRKQRLFAIGLGIIIYASFALTAILSYDRLESERIEEIYKQAKIDSIEISKIDWSGDYTFIDTSNNQDNKVIWKLNLKKDKSEHIGILKLLKHYETLQINCIGVIKKDGIEFYPDTTYRLFSGKIISYYDELFTFEKEDNEIITFWGMIKPINYQIDSDVGLFKKATAANTAYK